ncbi:ornithine cyclodeaminase family protein [Benzoatithermus flavus]|uniref:Ornithine cyclodeaminase family protein n=1 Tax=Benzoatithermus flavus TaxID=3108223 RepID=A0ABU8XTB9_9PROT
MLKAIDAASVETALPYARLIERLREGFRAAGETPVRHHHAVPRPGQDPAILLLMPAWQPGDVTGVKLVHVASGNEAKGLPSVQGVYVLFDGPTGTPLAVMDGTALTVRRTAAASALAASYLARPAARVLTMVGAGAMAPHLVRAHAAVRPVAEVRLWNRSRPRAEALAAALAGEPFRVAVVDDLEAAVRTSDIVACATMSREPLVCGAWLAPGTHLDLVGAFTPEMRESDDEVMRRGEVFVDTRAGALAEAGDILRAIAAGALTPERIRADLFELVRGRHPGRRSEDEITVFKSVGSALEDLIAAKLVHETLAG